MRKTRRWRVAVASTGMLLAMGVASLAVLGIGALSGAGSFNADDSIIEVAELGICIEAEAAEAAAAPYPACDACPKRIPGEPCTRVSCEPCCYRCSGEPVLRCY